eukprot:1145914-Pelagomonas_calceolata.AAC.5
MNKAGHTEQGTLVPGLPIWTAPLRSVLGSASCSFSSCDIQWILSGVFSPAHPFLQHQLSVQAVYDFLMQCNKKLLYFMSELLNLLLTCLDQPQADQPNSLAEGLPV